MRLRSGGQHRPRPGTGETELKDLRPDCLIIDLASKPGGVDRKAADRLGRQVIWALSLPGKVAPVTAGGAIRSTIYNMLPRAGRVISGKEGCNMEHKTVGFAVCGSFCTHHRAMEALEAVKARYDHVIPIVSEVVADTDTRFGTAHDLMREMERICDHRVIATQKGGGAHRPQGPAGPADHRPLHRQHPGQAGLRHRRHHRHPGRQGPPAQLPPHPAGSLYQRRAGRLGPGTWGS